MKFKQFLAEEAKKNLVVFYGGRFQPMHKGHFELYNSLIKKFGKDNVYISTKLSKDAEKQHSKGDFSKDPLTFEEKVKVITKMFDIKKDHIVNMDPYRPDLEKIGRDPKSTSVVLAFSEKDAGRLIPGKVMQPYPKDDKNLEPLMSGTEEESKSRMYYVTMPVNFSGMSASDFRAILIKNGDGPESKKAFKQFFGKDVDTSVLKLLVGKLHVKEGLQVPFTVMTNRVWPDPKRGRMHSGMDTITVDSNKPKVKVPKHKKGKKLFNESMAKFNGQGKYKGQVCYVLDKDTHNQLTIQFLDGHQLHGVNPTEVTILKPHSHENTSNLITP